MNVDATVDLSDVQNKLEELGATVIWTKGKPKGTSVRLEAEVDNCDAYEALPSHFFEVDEESSDFADERDVSDFVAALARGDRPRAISLVTRIWPSSSNQLAFERGISRALSS